MKAMKNILLVMMLTVASVGLVACGMDKGADEDSLATEEVTTLEETTREETTMEEVTTEREADEETKKDRKDDGVVGDIIDDAETKVDEVESDLED
ncbi:MAG: hypothetical protein K6G64_04795 [Eubacterium sp.]|nr:hypothetical protein [Eubacterium sp.]